MLVSLTSAITGNDHSMFSWHSVPYSIQARFKALSIILQFIQQTACALHSLKQRSKNQLKWEANLSKKKMKSALYRNSATESISRRVPPAPTDAIPTLSWWWGFSAPETLRAIAAVA
jgi:hypothetical protein